MFKRKLTAHSSRLTDKTSVGKPLKLLAVDCELSTVNCFSERRTSFLRSDSDSNTYNTFSTPSTLCSESERKDETTPYHEVHEGHQVNDFEIISDLLRVLRGEKEFEAIYEL